MNAEHIAIQREKFAALSPPMRHALLMRMDGVRVSWIGRRMGITTQEAKILLDCALKAMGA